MLSYLLIFTNYTPTITVLHHTLYNVTGHVGLSIVSEILKYGGGATNGFETHRELPYEEGCGVVRRYILSEACDFSYTRRTYKYYSFTIK